MLGEKVYRTLIKTNPDNGAYYKGLEKSLRIEDKPEEQVKVYSQYADSRGGYRLPNRLLLDCTEGDQFKMYVWLYIKNALEKGAPPLFTDLRPLYKNPSKVSIIQQLFESTIVQLKDHSRFLEGTIF